MTDGYRVRIFESELRVICDETLSFPNIETGGNLYGLLSHGGSPIVSLATRPAGRINRSTTSLELDYQAQQMIEELVWAQYGIQFVGMWHSHHQIGLYEPSEGDRHRTANYAVKAQRKFYMEILCNLPRGTSSGQVHVVPAPGERFQDETADDHEREEQDQTRKSRRAQAREEKRRLHDAACESGRGSEHRSGRSGHERSAGPVSVAPFVYVDATRLERADAEFVILPGTSPVRAAVTAADMRGVLAEAFRPVRDGSREGISYKLRASMADRSGGYHRGQSSVTSQQSGVPHKVESPTTTDVRERADIQQATEARAPAGASQVPADATTTAIPDMPGYVRDYVEPLLRTQPEYLSTLEAINEKKLVLRVRGGYGRPELLLVLGWDGAAPVVLSCAIMSGDRAVSWPKQLDRHDMSGCFNWGVSRL